jgi:hypothetical protein
MSRFHRPRQLIRLAITGIILSILLSSCFSDFDFPNIGISAITPTPPPAPILQAEVMFRAQIPFQTPGDQLVYLEILDEVTGLGLNPRRYQMEAQPPNHFSIRLPISIGSVVKYRYVLGLTSPFIENTPNGNPVRYRMAKVSGPLTIQDVISAWNGSQYQGETGRIFGKITDKASGMPAADVLVTAGGQQTVSASDGTYILNHVAAGTHLLAAYSMHGEFEFYSQGALVAPDSATLADLQLSPAQHVKVTFIADVPEMPVENATIRIIGNLYSLGNSFADLGGGINSVATRAPQMSKLDDGRYGIIMQLPSGFDLRYKYSLGDGFWNAEHENGAFLVRQLLVPDEDTIVEDQVETWTSGTAAPIVFIVRTPINTPKDDQILIQFNPYSWLEPLPMWHAGPNEWIYVLSSPLDILSEVEYRYCRNAVCYQERESNDPLAGGFFTTSSEVQYYQDTIAGWPNWSPADNPTVVPSLNIEGRGASFRAGVELAPLYQPRWSVYQDNGIKRVRDLNGNLLVITPTWSYTQQDPPMLEAVPGIDGIWQDWLAISETAQKSGIPLAIYPSIRYPSTLEEWWSGITPDLSWWYSWYDRYQTFLLHHARIAQQTGAEALIIGGPDITPSFPNGVFPDGSPSRIPAEAESRWREIIAEIRKVYSGKLLLALPYTGSLPSPPPFTRAFDGVYLLWSPSMPALEDETVDEIADAVKFMLERDIRPLRHNTARPLFIAVEFDSLDSHKNDGSKNLQKQANLYNAMLTSIHSLPWIDGFISRGYDPTLAQQDTTASINGKPAWNVLWYWYPRLLDDPGFPND